MNNTKTYESAAEIFDRKASRNVLVRYHACTVCFGVQDFTRVGKRAAVECCAEHKNGAK